MVPYLLSVGKAITAAIVTLLASVVTALEDNSISGQEGVTSAIAFFVALGAVWAIPWVPVKSEPAPAPPTTRVRRGT